MKHGRLVTTHGNRLAPLLSGGEAPESARTSRGMRQAGVVRKRRAMQIDMMTEALLCAIKSDVRQRVDDIVDGAEQAAMSLDSEQQVEQLLEVALVRVEEAIAEAARAMAREIHRDWDA
jgi:hypothetical protein